MPSPTIIDVTGSEAVCAVLTRLLNQFPILGETEHIGFASLNEDKGIGFFPSAGAALVSDFKDIVGHVSQVCAYPFTVVYRCSPRSEAQRMRVQEWLSLLGRWLERQPITVGSSEHNRDNTEPSDVTYQLEEYPELESGNRVITAIRQTNAAHMNAAYNNGVEDWALSLTLRYTNDYDE